MVQLVVIKQKTRNYENNELIIVSPKLSIKDEKWKGTGKWSKRKEIPN